MLAERAASRRISNTTGETRDPRASTGPPPTECSPTSFFSMLGWSVAKRHVDDNGHVGTHPVRAYQRAAAVPRDLLLRGGRCDDPRLARALLVAPKGLEHRERPMRSSIARETIRSFGKSEGARNR